MNQEIAEFVKFLRLGSVCHSWRRIAELVVEEFPGYAESQGWPSDAAAHGNQLFGKDLCHDAAEFLDIEELKE